MSRSAILLLILPVFVDAVLAELRDCAPSLAAWLLQRAVKRLPEPHRERFREEWDAILNEVPGKLTKIATTIGFWLYAPFVGQALGLPSMYQVLRERIRSTAYILSERHSAGSVALVSLLLALVIVSVLVAVFRDELVEVARNFLPRCLSVLPFLL
jgi:hypothetical protein